MCKTLTLIAIFNHIMIQTYVEAQVIGELEIDFIIAVYHQLVQPCSPSTSPPSLSVQLKSARPEGGHLDWAQDQKLLPCVKRVQPLIDWFETTALCKSRSVQKWMPSYVLSSCCSYMTCFNDPSLQTRANICENFYVFSGSLVRDLTKFKSTTDQVI